MTTAQIKKRLKDLRGEDTQRAISSKLGVDAATWSRAENYGIVGPLLKLAVLRVYKIDLDEGT